MKRLVSCAIVALVAGVSVSLLLAADDAKPKYTIKEVMKFQKDEKLVDKFKKGEISKDEKQKLQDGYEAMLKQKPPKGDEKAWKEKVEAVIKSIKDNDKDAFGKATNCGACHGAHKPS
ncbi:MAG TPA: hypothetical protein VGM05_03245 [Planctomycetaceae bacterium]